MNSTTKIAYVGNGPINNIKLSNFIDSCDIVVRFNAFEIAGYEHLVGTKTTIWCCNSGCPQLHKLERQCEECWVVVRPNGPPPKKAKQIFQGHANKIAIIPTALERKLTLNLSHCPSTGIIGLAYGLKELQGVAYTFGFTNFDRSQKFHYYRKSDYWPWRKEKPHHNHPAEKNYLYQLQQRGKIWNPVTLL